MIDMKNFRKGFWTQTVPAYTTGISALALLAFGIIPAYYLIATLVMWILVSGLGIAVGYHRIFSHKTHVLPIWKENIILFFASLGAQSSSIFWVAAHRGYHHPYSDQPRDIHSPVQHGKFNAFLGWTMRITENNNPVNFKYAVDLLRKPNHMWFHKHYVKIMWGVPLVVSLFDWKLALVGFCLVSMISTIQDNLVNIYGHTPVIGSYRNYDTKDHSQNNLFFGYFGWGQGWHNNHHYSPGDFDFGSGISKKWWEFDPCRLFLPFIGKPSVGK